MLNNSSIYCTQGVFESALRALRDNLSQVSIPQQGSNKPLPRWTACLHEL